MRKTAGPSRQHAFQMSYRGRVRRYCNRLLQGSAVAVVCTCAFADVTDVAGTGTLTASAGAPSTINQNPPQTIPLSGSPSFSGSASVSNNSASELFGDIGSATGSSSADYSFDPDSLVLSGSGSATEDADASCTTYQGNEYCGSSAGNAGAITAVSFTLTTSYSYTFSYQADPGTGQTGLVVLQDKTHSTTIPSGSGTLIPGSYRIVGNAVGSVSATAPSKPSQSDSQSFSYTLSLLPIKPLTIVTELPSGMEGVAYPTTPLVSGGTPPYTTTVSGLPAGLQADSSGQINGTPAAGSSSGSPYSVTVSVTDADGNSVGPVQLSLIIGAIGPLAITTRSLSSGQAYSLSPPTINYLTQLSAQGGTPPYTWKVSGLPPGVVLDSVAGLTVNLVGRITSSVPDVYKVDIVVQDVSNLMDPKTLTLATYCGDPDSAWTNQDPAGNVFSGPGDARDALIDEYVRSKVGFNYGPVPFAGSKFNAPHCDQFTQTEPEFITGVNPPYSYAWWVVRQPEVGGYANWQRNIASGAHPLTSGYRNPYRNGTTPNSATLSRHMYGDAVDLQSFSGSESEWDRLEQAARAAGAQTLETNDPRYPCRPQSGPHAIDPLGTQEGHVKALRCAHADWRYSPGSYLHP